MPGHPTARRTGFAAAIALAACAAGLVGGAGFALAIAPALLLLAALVAGFFPGEQRIEGWRALRSRARARRAAVVLRLPAPAAGIRARVTLLAGVAGRRGPPRHTTFA